MSSAFAPPLTPLESDGTARPLSDLRDWSTSEPGAGGFTAVPTDRESPLARGLFFLLFVPLAVR